MFQDKKLNSIKLITCASILLAFFSSCEDLVDEQPISEIGVDGFYSNNQQLEAGVIAIYDGMQGTYNDRTFLWGEFRSDNHVNNLTGQTTTDNLEITNNDITQGNNAVRWDRFYRMIDRANQVISNAPNVPGLNENLLAEALAIRAKAYFDGIRVWGGIPLFTEPFEFPSDPKPATDASTIMNEIIIPDMLRAEELMTSISSNFRFSKSSIFALQAEVYMWQNDYPNAKSAIESLIDLGQHSLVTTPMAWDDLFHNNEPIPEVPDGRGKVQTGPELIFSIRYDLEEAINFGGTRNNRSRIMNLFFSGAPSFYISDVVENKWREKFPIDSLGWVTKYPDTDPVLTRTDFENDGMGGIVEIERPVYGDWRFYFTREDRIDGLGIEIGRARTAKWQQTNYAQNFDNTDIVLYRYADMILLLAEAENQLGNQDRALELVNQIRTARQLPLVTTEEFGATLDDRVNYLLDERQLELFGEGKRWWDLVRNDKAIEIMNPILAAKPQGVELTEDRLVWPIFVEHLIENPLLEQNIGYSF